MRARAHVHVCPGSFVRQDVGCNTEICVCAERHPRVNYNYALCSRVRLTYFCALFRDNDVSLSNVNANVIKDILSVIIWQRMAPSYFYLRRDE